MDHHITEDTYNNDLVGLPNDYSPAERAYDIKKAAEAIQGIKIKYIGKDKAQVTIVKERWEDKDHRDYGDNNKANPEENWEAKND